jgi:polyketide synthase PksN
MNLDNLMLDDIISQDAEDNITQVKLHGSSKKDIAIIGMSGKIGRANNLDEFWHLLKQGDTLSCQLSESRKKDIEDYLNIQNLQHLVSDSDYLKESFLESIDQFDNEFFSIAKKEANLIDPNQRLFLQSSWAALEDAGYAGDSIRGSQTGVFVGFSNDFSYAYKNFIEIQMPEAPEVSVVGNIKSIIASRIAYQLDLKGPSMMIDTACSSSLVAIHQACRSLRQGECDMAIAGGVKIDFIPVLRKEGSTVGVRDIKDNFDPDAISRTFDDNCHGMSVGEGVISFILKPLSKAIADSDNIHAVIKGSAINQDGQSIGITAPNTSAQENLIKKALNDARISAEQVSYIEAHGTATRLGDPIEVKGISNAFSAYSNKKQFCAIGSVKSNIGHLDNLAGAAGLAKVVMSMKHQKLPASLHFNKPNKSIAFEQSPVYVCDTNQEWSDKEHGVVAGINSFGLSGTNCHVVVQSYETGKVVDESSLEPEGSHEPELFLISAQSKSQLLKLISDYLEFLPQTEVSLKNISYTAAVGRLHGRVRLAIIAFSLESLIEQLMTYHLEQKTVPEKIKLSEALDVSTLNDIKTRYLSADSDQSKTASLQQLSSAYIQGISIDWSKWFEGRQCHRISLPTYPFNQTRCWVDNNLVTQKLVNDQTNAAAKKQLHPLLNYSLLDSMAIQAYSSELSAETHWELADHKVKNVYVLPGTCYVEMMLQATRRLAKHYPGKTLCFEKISFLSPFTTMGREVKRLDVQVIYSAQAVKIVIASPLSASANAAEIGDWNIHAEAKLSWIEKTMPATLDIKKLINHLSDELVFNQNDDLSRGLDIGERWNSSVQKAWSNNASSEYLVYLSLDKKFYAEKETYYYHPALLDTAINAANHLVDEDSLFLPLSYDDFSVYQQLPLDFYVHLKRLETGSDDIAKFRVQLVDLQGTVVAQVKEYIIKRVPETELFAQGEASSAISAFALELKADASFDLTHAIENKKEPLLIFHYGEAKQKLLIQAIESQGFNVLDINFSENDLSDELASEITKKSFTGAVVLPQSESTYPVVQLKNNIQNLATISKFVVKQKIALSQGLLVVTEGAFIIEERTTSNRPDTTSTRPGNASLAALTRISAMENPHINIRCLDNGQETQAHDVLLALNNKPKGNALISRGKQVYQESLRALKLQSVESFPLSEQGAYIITGGTGGLGLALAKTLLEQMPVNLILLGSQDLPEKHLWQKTLAESQDEKLKTKLEKLIELDELDGSLEYHATPLSEKSQLEELLIQIRLQYGKVNGVVHAAGKAGDGFLIHKSAQELDSVISAKVDAAWYLHELTLTDELDFFVMYSSVATSLRSPGQSDYTAANAYLDSLAYLRRSMQLPALSIAWPAWREVGIAVEYNAVNEAEFFAPINNQQALNLLKSAIHYQQELPPAIVLAPLNQSAKLNDLEQLDILPSSELVEHINSQVQSSDERSNGEQTKVAITSIDDPDEIDLMVAQTWGRVLGVTEIDVDDVFNDLGGNSILTTQMYRDFDNQHPEAVDMADLFTYTTIRSQAEHFRKYLGLTKKGEDTKIMDHRIINEPDMDEVLARLARGDISTEEAQALL